MRLGVMGGTFDPIHHGHLVAASEVQSRFDLDEVVFVPTGQPWQKADRDVSPAEDRYLMTVIATASNPRFTVSRVDIDRPGPTYTIDTLRDIRTERPDDELFFITGADALAEILSWKDADQLWELAHFIGVTRPGHELSDKGLPERPGHAAGGAGHGDQLDRLPRARRRRRAGLVPRARRGRPVHQQVPPVCRRPAAGTVPMDLRRTRPRRFVTAADHSIQLAKVAALAAEEKIAEKVMAIDVSDQMPLTDVFVIASGPTERQVGAIVDEVEDRLRELGSKPIRREGEREGRWVLIDFGDIIVHVQHEEERDYYALERLWKDCPEIDLSVGPGAAVTPDAATSVDDRRDAPGPCARGRAGSSSSGTPRPSTTRPGSGRATRTPSCPDRGHEQVEAAAPHSPPTRRRSSSRATSGARPRRPTPSRAAPACAVRLDARLREVHVGEWQGLHATRCASATPSCHRGPRPRRGHSARGHRGDPGAGGRARRRRPARRRWELSPGQTAVVVAHGVSARVAASALVGLDQDVSHAVLPGARQLPLDRARRGRQELLRGDPVAHQRLEPRALERLTRAAPDFGSRPETRYGYAVASTR